MRSFEPLFAAACPPAEDAKTWYERAIDAVAFVTRNVRSEEIILLCTCGQLIMNTVLVPTANLNPPNFDDIERCNLWDGEWAIEHCSGGGEPDQVYLSAPLERFGTSSMAGGEKLVFRRSFSGVDRGGVRTELSQKLIQALGLYWMDEEAAYCRLDEQGDIEPVIRVIDLEKATGKKGAMIVTILAEALHRFMAAGDFSMVVKFDATRFEAGNFIGWHNPGRIQHRDDQLSYHAGVQSGCSFVAGSLIVPPLLTKDMLIDRFNGDWRDTDKQYATFKANDWKNGRLAEISCAPSALASYFEKESDLPFEVTPAFFNPEVLQRYKQDTEKFTLEHRAIYSRAGWSLQTYDVNEAGQVHTYLCYLSRLPYKEQLYWQAFNEWPKGPISERAYQTDFEGSFSTIADPLVDLKYEISKLDNANPDWWQPRGEDAARAVQYALTTSPDEWADAILALDQLVVEGFTTKGLRARLDGAARSFDKSWGSLRLLQEYLISKQIDDEAIASTMEPLKMLHHLRSKVRGHHSDSEKRALIKQARVDHGSLSAHFRNLAGDVQFAMDQIIELM